MLAKDLGFAARALRKSPAFTITAMLTLALGIGASTAIFSVVNGVLLRPLPYADPDRLVIAWGELRARNVMNFPFSPPDFADVRADVPAFESLAGVNSFRAPLTGDDGEPQQVKVIAATTNIFSLLGTRMALGRGFVDADGTPNQPPPQNIGGAQPTPPPAQTVPAVAVLSYEFWRSRYGGDPKILGRGIDLGGARAQIVGVTERGTELLFPTVASVERQPDIWIAARINFSTAPRINVFLRVIGRLKPGVSLAVAQNQVERVTAEMRRKFPISNTANYHIRLEPMQADLVRDVRPALVALMGAVMFVLLIACANVANLLLVRASRRERELAIRAALGGSQWRLVRQLFAESMLLAGAGAVLGIALAEAGIKLLVRVAPATLPRLDAVAIDPLVLVFAIAVSAIAAVLFGMVPAIRASRPDLADVLRASGRAPGLGGGRVLRNAVVVAEVALSFVLLVGSGLMLRTFIAVSHVELGYDPSNVLTFTAPNPRLRTLDQNIAWEHQMAEKLAAIPGVRAVTSAFPFPLDGAVQNARWGTEKALTDPSTFQQANVHVVQPGYFEAMRARLIAGRTFTQADDDTSAKVVIIDDKLAAKAFPDGQAVGKRLYIRARSLEPEWLTVVGVVKRQRHESLTSDEYEATFYPDGMFGHNAGRWAVRTTGDPTRIVPQLRAVVAELDPRVPLGEVRRMSENVDRALAPTRFALVLIAIFASVAAVLAAVGLYGVLATVVRQRTAEIGVRLAFGAPRRSILSLVIGEGMRLSGLGMLAGIVGALALTRVIRSLLVGVSSTDPVTYTAMAIVFAIIAMAACWIPAHRAATLDPTVALREE